MKLVEPELDLQAEFYRYCDAFRLAGEPVRPLEELAYQDFSRFIKRTRELSLGIGIPPGYVPSTVYWLMREDRRIVGNSSLRHALTPGLERIGGHIGYAIHPQERSKGYGTLLLKLTLEKAKEKGIQKVLVTCDTANTASNRIILHNGGVLAGEGLYPETGNPISRYWIDLSIP